MSDLPLRVAYERPLDALTGQPSWAPAGGAWAKLIWAQAQIDRENAPRVLARFLVHEASAPAPDWRLSARGRRYSVRALEPAPQKPGFITLACEEVAYASVP